MFDSVLCFFCISLTPHYHFHPLHKHLDISHAITAESAPLHIGSKQPDSKREPFVSRRTSLTTNLRALSIGHQKYQNFEVKLSEAKVEQIIAIITTPRVSCSTKTVGKLMTRQFFIRFLPSILCIQRCFKNSFE